LCSCILSCVTFAAIIAGPIAAASAATPPAGEWIRPVDGAVARAFDPPAHRFGPGHLGVDFRAAAGTPVRAAGAGEVTLAGNVAGTLHVVVAHAGGLRTSYSFLASVAVHKGEHVAAGDTLGTSGGTAGNHDGTVVHLGLRSGAEYLDPMLLFGAVDLAEVVHLAPTAEPFGFTAAGERRSLLDGVRDSLGGAVDVAARAGRAAGGVTVQQVSGFVERNPGVAVGREMLAFADERRHCDASAPPANGTGGSAHRLMVVAGIDSHTNDAGVTLGLPVDDLGYGADEVTFFSYATNGGRYDARDTYRPLMESARLLAAQLREQQRRDPGREVDLVAHSQGGVVVLAFLKLVYEPGDPAYPPLGTVVTLSSPLEGAPLATTLERVGGAPGGSGALDVAGDTLAMPDPNSAAVRDLAQDSAFMARLDAAPLPENIQITTIGSTYDYTVPADHATSDDAQQHTVVETFVTGGHTRVIDDEDAMRATRAALEGAPLPCRSFGEFVRAEVIPPTFSALESAGQR
jgi:alpha-beta hydrolase superfamily lysophospholipase